MTHPYPTVHAVGAVLAILAGLLLSVLIGRQLTTVYIAGNFSATAFTTPGTAPTIGSASATDSAVFDLTQAASKFAITIVDRLATPPVPTNSDSMPAGRPLFR